MITLEHINIYKFYRDGDYFVRMSSDKEKKIMTYKDWSMIDNFIQDLSLVIRGAASDSFSKKLFDRLKEHCENEEVIIELENISRQQ
ncbi:hypothetical protein [uncultured Chryseobacterium sp.]|jgi:hypothetical protein|uniref:hypothetical protein n=1 Tax=uncultured Chryseobacterium sp. TaxID=259322 RepID=UPI0026038588|nr:hypothetical protein [uncultured Chryseobacterium sp.]